jgi:cell division protein FtsQ
MWHKPRLLVITADLLMLVGVVLLGVAAAKWLAHVPLLPVRHVVVTSELREVTRGELEQAIGTLRGNLYSVSLDGVRSNLERLPWVRRADVRRRWPDTLEVTLHEQRAVARWGEGTQQLVNNFGEVFYGSAGSGTNANRVGGLPTFIGPLGTAPDLLARYEEMKALLVPIGRQPRQLILTPRLAWQVKLDDGLWLEVGREQQKAQIAQRLRRFAGAYAQTVAARQPKPVVADLRYPNGFVLRGARANDATGSQPG